MIHVALLRGINVGGKHKVPMAALRRICAGVGFRDVETYINSGNIVFAADDDELTLGTRLEDAIESAFGFRARVLVRTGSDVLAIAAAIPADWSNDDAMKTDVVYLLDGVDPVDATASLRPRGEVDHVLHAPGAFIWMVSRRDATRSGLLRIAGTTLYQQSTVRNVNTARKLAAMVAVRSPADSWPGARRRSSR